MRYFICLFAGVLSSFVLFSQSTPLPLNFKSYAITLCVAKDESLVLTTKAGEIGLAESIKSTWRKTEPKEDKDLFGLTLEQPNFFNKDTGFVSGYINGGKDYDIIYHTTNGGKKWTAIDFGEGGWVDNAFNLDNGEAWLSVAGSGLAYTNDYGFTWKKLTIPEVKQRFTNIFFNGQHQGIIGSLWNLLAYTGDNCKTWKWLPTPLDQKAYSKTNKNSRPAFDRIAILNDLLLVKQEGLVFYSKKDSIRWIWLKNYDDFYTDGANTAVYLQTNKGTIVRADFDLNPIYDFKQVMNSYDTKCKNGNLFVICQDKIYKLDSANKINSYSFKTNESSDIDPVQIGYANNGIIGVLNNKAYAQKEYNGKWQAIFDFPFDINDGRLSINEYNLVIYNRNDDSLFYIDLSGKEVLRKSKTKMLMDFCKEEMKEIRFEKGSQGCFHFYQDDLGYIKNNGVFISQGIESSDSKRTPKLPENSDEIDEQEINLFVSKITSLADRSKQVTIADLAFTEQEYDQCKKDILEFKESLQSTKKRKKETKFAYYENNIDFDRLLSLVDSIKLLDAVRLNQILTSPTDFWSTTNFWTGFKLVNNKNQTLSVTSRYYASNAFYFPWIVHLDGYIFNTTNIEVNKFVERVYPSFLEDKDRMDVLYALVKKIY